MSARFFNMEPFMRGQKQYSQKIFFMLFLKSHGSRFLRELLWYAQNLFLNSSATMSGKQFVHY